jgi:hypothetical protein
MGIPEARRILGTYKIIGATANTFEDVLTHVQIQRITLALVRFSLPPLNRS